MQGLTNVKWFWALYQDLLHDSITRHCSHYCPLIKLLLGWTTVGNYERDRVNVSSKVENDNSCCLVWSMKHASLNWQHIVSRVCYEWNVTVLAIFSIKEFKCCRPLRTKTEWLESRKRPLPFPWCQWQMLTDDSIFTRLTLLKKFVITQHADLQYRSVNLPVVIYRSLLITK